jgi:8-oxo-dGTP diphosphatase
VQRDGNGWVTCAQGHQHWGIYGAAGLLAATSSDAGRHVLLQLRAPTSHFGDTWGLPGGARDSHETPSEAALREATEETTIDPAPLEILAEHLDDHGGWSYVTVLATSPTTLAVEPLAESADVQWVPIGAVDSLPLHPGFAATWPVVRAVLELY